MANTSQEDYLVALGETFAQDPTSNKLNLGGGAYCGEDGNLFLLNTVKTAAEQLAHNHAYPDSALGLPDFTHHARLVAFGDTSTALPLIASAQTPGGTGALRVAAALVKKTAPTAFVYLPTPTYSNHLPILRAAGLQTRQYRYLPSSPSFHALHIDFDGLQQDLSNAAKGSVVMFHACGHNPTGMDISHDQWKRLATVLQPRKFDLLFLFDNAYQGLVSGSVEDDGFSFRHFIERGFKVMVAQSFSKIMGLYGERTGCLHIVTENQRQKAIIQSQLISVIRPMYSVPPIYGARIVTHILADAQLKEQWYLEVRSMVQRVKKLRQDFVSALERAQTKKRGSPKSWQFILTQSGLFSQLPLSTTECEKLANQFHFHLASNGRLNIARLNQDTLSNVADAIVDVMYSSRSGSPHKALVGGA